MTNIFLLYIHNIQLQSVNNQQLGNDSTDAAN